MADEESQKGEDTEEGSSLVGTASPDGEGELAETAGVRFEGGTPANLGSLKYVHASFFAAGVLVAYLAGKLLATLWNALAETAAVYERVPFLLRYSEDERPTFTMLVGAIIGIVAVFWTYRKEGIERWALEVSSELAKVYWPDKETVTNGTVVVVVVSALATVYVGLLDRLWSFVTTLVYGT